MGLRRKGSSLIKDTGRVIRLWWRVRLGYWLQEPEGEYKLSGSPSSSRNGGKVRSRKRRRKTHTQAHRCLLC